MSDKLKNLIVRTVSGIGLLLVVVLASLGIYTYGLFLLLITVVGMLEFYNIAAAVGCRPQRTLGLVSGIVLFITGFALFKSYALGAGLDYDMFIGGAIYFIALIPLSFILELFVKSETPLRNIASTLMGVLYVALPMSLMLYIPMMLSGRGWMPAAFLFYLFIVWANDVFAYLVGVTIGKHRMCERISPKKSWEGFVGGVVGALGMGALGAYVVGGSYGVWIGLAVVVAITGVLGDLVESMLKREAGIKDSGNIMPGHGGMLDRFDALLISAPFAFAYLVIMML